MTGYTRDEFDKVVGDKYTNIVAEEDRAAFLSFAQTLGRAPGIESLEYRMVGKNGKSIYVSDTMESILDDDGIMRGYSSVTDITPLKEKQKELAEERERYHDLYLQSRVNEQRFRMIGNYTGIVFYEYDLENQRILSMENTEHLLGYAASEVIAGFEHHRKGDERTIPPIIHPEDWAVIERDTARLMESRESHCEIRIRRKNGAILWCILNRYLLIEGAGATKRSVGCIINTEREHRQTEKLRQQLAMDPMTKLRNKSATFKAIAKTLENHGLCNHALLAIDLDNFKQANDQLGHAMGDEILMAFAKKMERLFGETDILARVGGDEFIVFIPAVTSQGEVRRKANQLVSIVKSEIGMQSAGIDISASVGIAFSEESMDVNDLFLNADLALYDAKHKGKGQVSIYDGKHIVAPEYNQLNLLEGCVNGGVGIYKVHPEWMETTYCSEGLPELIGYQTDDVTHRSHRNAWEHIYSGDLDKVKQAMNRCIACQKQVDVIFRMQHKEGAIVWVQALAEVISIEDGCPMVHVVFNNMSRHMALYNDVLDASDAIIHLSDMNTMEVLYANTAATKSARRKPGSYLGQKCYQWFAHRETPCEDCHIDVIRREGISSHEHYWDMDGRYYTMTGKALDWEGRKVFAEYVTDITDLKKAQESLVQYNTQLKKQYDDTVRSFLNNQDGYITLIQYDLEEDRIVRVEERNEQRRFFSLGMNHKEILDVFNQLIPGTENREPLKTNLHPQKLKALYQQGDREDQAYLELRLPGIGLLYVQCLVTLRKEPVCGHISAFIRLIDQSSKAASEAIIEKLVPQSYESIGLIDKVTGAYHLYLEDEKNSLAWHPDYDGAVMAYFQENKLVPQENDHTAITLHRVVDALNKAPLYEQYGEIITADGTRRHKKMMFSHLNDKKSVIMYCRQDVTDVLAEEQKTRERLTTALQMAEMGNRSKETFLAKMSHDMRTPMNTVLGLVALTENVASEPEMVLENLDKIKEASKEMLALVNDILDRTMMDSGTLVLKQEPYHYMEFLEALKSVIAPMCQKKNITLSFETVKRAITIFVDKQRLNQVFLHILINAVKFTPPGGEISYYTDNVTLENGYISVDYYIKDTGIGMSKAFQERMFEPFAQEDTTITPEYQGSGLGLSIVKNMVALMGGTLTVSSTKGVGTVVKIHLTFKLVSKDARIDVMEPRPVPAPVIKKTLAGKHILLVEDNPLNAVITAKLLEVKGIHVTCAENGRVAVERFKESAPGFYAAILMDIRMPVMNGLEATRGFYAAILMDIRMPVMNGLEATRAIRHLPRPDALIVPIIALTANAYDTDKAASYAAGMNAHLAKPVEPQRLYGALEEKL